MSVAENFKHIHSRIEKSCKAGKRSAHDVHLVAVSKVQPEDRIKEALETGQRIFGENKVQEAYAHWHHLRSAYPDLKLHLIGPLQTNKAKDAVALFDVIETLDREKLARTLAKEMEKQGRKLPCFIQVNTGEEEQKSGITPKDVHRFYRFCTEECGLDIQGLMCIPPVDEPPALHFALLAKLARELDLPDLSMGMSNDFEKAIPLGATYIRVGTAVFGERAYT